MLRNKRGVTLVELIVAMVIMTVAILSGAGSFKVITQAIRGSRTRTIASNLGQEKYGIDQELQLFHAHGHDQQRLGPQLHAQHSL